MVSLLAWAAANSSGRTGSARRTSGSTARATGTVGVASAIEVGTGVEEGAAIIGVLFAGAAVAATLGGVAIASARGAIIVATAALGLAAGVPAASAGRGAMRCRFERKCRNQNPATRIAIAMKKGTNDGRVFSLRRVIAVRGAFGAGVSCR